MNQAITDCVRMLRTPEILRRLGVSHSHWWRLELNGQCPVRARLGARARGLPEDALDGWLEHCMALRSTVSSLTDPITLPPWSPGLVLQPCPRGIEMLRLPEVERLVGLKHSAIYNAVHAHRFPWPVPLGARVRRWARHEIDAWLAERQEYLRELRSPARSWGVPASWPARAA